MPSSVTIYLEYYLDHKQDDKNIIEEGELEWDLIPYIHCNLCNPRNQWIKVLV